MPHECAFCANGGDMEYLMQVMEWLQAAQMRVRESNLTNKLDVIRAIETAAFEVTSGSSDDNLKDAFTWGLADED